MSDHRKRYLLLIVGTSITLAACGASQKSTLLDAVGTLPSSTAVPPATIDPVPPDLGSERIPVADRPTLAEVEAELATNENVRDGQLGSLCWARWEVHRLIISASLATDMDQRQAALDALADSRPEIEAEIERSMGALAAEVAPFAEALRSDLRQVPAPDSLRNVDESRANVEQLASSFEFANYPGQQEYGAAATYGGRCATP